MGQYHQKRQVWPGEVDHLHFNSEIDSIEREEKSEARITMWTASYTYDNFGEGRVWGEV